MKLLEETVVEFVGSSGYQAKFQLFKKSDQSKAVHKLDLWHTIADRLGLSVRSERARCDNEPLVSSAHHRTSKIPYLGRGD